MRAPILQICSSLEVMDYLGLLCLSSSSGERGGGGVGHRVGSEISMSLIALGDMYSRDVELEIGI